VAKEAGSGIGEFMISPVAKTFAVGVGKGNLRGKIDEDAAQALIGNAPNEFIPAVEYSEVHGDRMIGDMPPLTDRLREGCRATPIRDDQIKEFAVVNIGFGKEREGIVIKAGPKTIQLFSVFVKSSLPSVGIV